MKKAEEYIAEIGHGLYTSYGVKDDNNKFTSVMSIENAIKAIRKAQEDAIREAVKACADASQVDIIDHEELAITSLPGYDRNIGTVILPIYGADEDSILKVADKLIKEL
jgi:hypothetical protein